MSTNLASSRFGDQHDGSLPPGGHVANGISSGVCEQQQSGELSNSDRAGSGLEAFFQVFSHERNIRWMLVCGAAIVLGSSLMLVTREWSYWSATVQYLTVLGYTGAVYGFSELARHRLGLKTTAKIMQALTLLLLPISFLAVSWLSPGRGMQGVAGLALLLPGVMLTWLAGRRIFDDWLRKRQSTFLVSYVILSVAAASPAAESPSLAMGLSLLFWFVMSAGAMKVNRHIFWLTEEHRLPRIFGFFPIVLLCLQFLLLVSSKTFRSLPNEWLGLGCVLTAFTVMTTARAVAAVYRQRTGDLVRPLPWHIVAPLMTGSALTALGVGLSFYGFSYTGPTTLAVVPTALLAAALMGLAAGDTRLSGFTWAALICLTIAWQSTPTLISDVVQMIRQGAAAALQEPRLPVAFYGLTYLPLLLTLAAGSRYARRRGLSHFARPMQHYVTAVAAVLFCLSVTSLKALFLVSLVNLPNFIVLAILFSDRRYAIGALLGLLITAATLMPFAAAMHWLPSADAHMATGLVVVALGLTASRLPDRLLNRIPLPADRGGWLTHDGGAGWQHLCQSTGWVLSIALSIVWVFPVILRPGTPLTTPEIMQLGILLVIAMIRTSRTRRYDAGLAFWLLAAVGGIVWATGTGLPLQTLIAVTALGTAVVSVAGWVVILWPYRRSGDTTSWSQIRSRLCAGNSMASLPIAGASHSGRARLAEACVVPLCDLSLVVLSCLAAFCYLPMLLASTLFLWPLTFPLTTVTSVLWVFVVAVMFRNRLAAGAAACMLPLVAGALTIPLGVSYSTLPLVWAVACTVLMAATRYVPGPVFRPMQQVAETWLTVILLAGCLALPLPVRLASALAIASLAAVRRDAMTASQATWLTVIGHWNLLLLVAAAGGLTGILPLALVNAPWTTVLPLLTVALGMSLLIFDHPWKRLDTTSIKVWTTVLRGFSIVALLNAFRLDVLTPLQQALMIIGIALQAAAEFRQAFRQQQEWQIWSGLAVAALGVLWVFVQRLIEPAAGVSQFVMLGVSVSCVTMSQRVRHHAHLGIAFRPLKVLGLLLPAFVTVLAATRQVQSTDLAESARHTLTMLASAMLYFHQGLVTRGSRFHLAAGGILNLTLMLLWNSLHITDLQVYLAPLGFSVLGLVQLLKAELPDNARDPLRYCGALIILVSPLHEILGGSWLHLFSLMVLCVLVILLAIGLRLRVLVYTGTAFLMGDLLAMVVRSTIDHPGLLWVCGLGLGVSVITLAALCENHRENILGRIRRLSAELATWG